MNYWIEYIALFLFSECLLAIFFRILATIYYKKLPFDMKIVLIGTIERIFIILSLCNNFPTGLVMFGTLKVGTRLKVHQSNTDEENKFSNYYLIGNLISAIVAILFVLLFNYYSDIS